MKNKNEMVKKPKKKCQPSDNLLSQEYADYLNYVTEDMKTEVDEEMIYYSRKFKHFSYSSYGTLVGDLIDVKESQIKKALILVDKLRSCYGIIFGSYTGLCQHLFEKDDYNMDDLNNLTSY